MKNFSKIIPTLPSTIPFVGPEAQEREANQTFSARIGANESVFGPSPNAIIAMKNSLSEIWKYGDPENFDLKKEIAKKHNLSPKHIMVGEGIDAILGYLVRIFLNIGDNVVTTNGSYPTFNYHVIGYGGKLNKVSFIDDKEDLNRLLEVSNRLKAKILYVSNPNSPMGTINDVKLIANTINNLDKNTIMCLDEAYADFLSDKELPKINLDNKKVLRLRTFSKAYGLAGARVGYCIGNPDLISQFNKIRNHFGVCRISQVGALAALRDKSYLKSVKVKIRTSINELQKIAISNNCKFVDSYTNFLAIDCGGNGNYAQQVLKKLISYGIFVRMPFTAPQNRCIRVTAGTINDMRLFRKFFPIALREAKE